MAFKRLEYRLQENKKKGGGTLHEVSRLAGFRHLSGAANGATVTRVWGCRIQV